MATILLCPYLFLTVRVLLTGDINNLSEYIQSEFYLKEVVEHGEFYLKEVVVHEI